MCNYELVSHRFCADLGTKLHLNHYFNKLNSFVRQHLAGVARPPQSVRVPHKHILLEQ